MLIFILAYLGGLLTIFSPCVLPVLPFVFVRPGVPFRRGGLPILLGMAVTFALLSSLAAAGGAWLVGISQAGRYAAMGLLLVMGLALILPGLADRLMRPFSRLGERLQQRADRRGGVAGSALLGVAVGFLWAPCAGPILGLLLAGAALNGVNLHSMALLLAFALGASTSLGLALFAGERVYRLMKQGLGAEEWLRRALGIVVVGGVVVIALGWDTRVLSRFSFLSTAGTEQALITRLHPQPVPGNTVDAGTVPMPSIAGATLWLNSPPLDAAMLRGKVVLVDFWTYSCINCLRTLPYLKAWDQKYRAQGLVIVGVHAPEFAFEKNPHNVEQAVRELGIHYPVALDNHYAIWNAFNNRYWPAEYLVDARGYIREMHFGEGDYGKTERMIQTLLKEASGRGLAIGDGMVHPSGVGAMASASNVERSPETYVGYERQENLASPEAVARDAVAQYSAPRTLRPDQWALSGKWRVTAESATAESAGSAITYRFQGRDLHLVLGSRDGKPLHFRVTLDNAAPGASHGTDTDTQGNGTIREQRLYQLIRLTGDGAAHTVRIEFLAPGAQAYAFTFG